MDQCKIPPDSVAITVRWLSVQSQPAIFKNPWSNKSLWWPPEEDNPWNLLFSRPSQKTWTLITQLFNNILGHPIMAVHRPLLAPRNGHDETVQTNLWIQHFHCSVPRFLYIDLRGQYYYTTTIYSNLWVVLFFYWWQFPKDLISIFLNRSDGLHDIFQRRRNIKELYQVLAEFWLFLYIFQWKY